MTKRKQSPWVNVIQTFIASVGVALFVFTLILILAGGGSLL